MSMTPLRRRTTALVPALLCTVLALTACGSNSTSADNTSSATTSATRQVKADNGTVTVPANPRRVVTLGNATQAFLGVGGKPVGATEWGMDDLGSFPKDQQAAYKATVDLGASAKEADLEKIASLKPDLILTSMVQSDWDKLGSKFEAIAPTVFYSLTTDSLTVAAGFAEAAGKGAQLSEQKTEYQNKLAEIKQKYSDVIENTKFVELTRWASTEPGVFVINHIGCNEIGLENVGLNLPPKPATNTTGDTRSFEQLGELASKYDAILYPVEADGTVTDVFAPVTESNTWKALPLVKSGKALGVNCSGPGSITYGGILAYLDSLEKDLAALAAKE